VEAATLFVETGMMVVPSELWRLLSVQQIKYLRSFLGTPMGMRIPSLDMY
jgi:hypothetical protein